ncbi:MULTISPECIES: PDR/VanB family oxidoreductase [Pseudomonas aeruginosa group]|uniref:Oxidoreductase n=1 Tax=Pseudomonas nitroreducens TaxID=46680 RepID=A0A6G6IS90_PSENT|nr:MULTISPECIES: PDR/VanB family oxidoreductase [Pseudomonas aeruginosa group]KYO75115.1 Phthalate dioxygenase reductase [Pseudomonas aeruginosa]QIE86005.1 oxidoreductase [Pseudomonas nitroreducens]HCE6396344.1 oxidoreductase [Pseudomonas aeruginosa]
MLEVLVAHKKTEAEGIASFELVQANGQPLPSFAPGAHIDVHLPSGLVRQYSLCSPPEERHRYLIAVLEEPESRGGSRALHHQVQVGQTLQIGEPRNLFPLAEQRGKSLLFAGGIGITPILAMARYLARRGEDFELHYCARTPQRAAFLDWLRKCPFAERVRLHFDDGAPEQRLDAAQVLAAPAADSHVYVCGPGGFMQHILGNAATRGWPAERVHREYFAAPASAPVELPGDGTFEVELARSGRVYRVPAERSVFEVLDEAGVVIPVSCEQGICGACLTGVLDGIPDHRDAFQTDEEKAANRYFTPCCSRARSARLLLDL